MCSRTVRRWKLLPTLFLRLVCLNYCTVCTVVYILGAKQPSKSAERSIVGAWLFVSACHVTIEFVLQLMLTCIRISELKNSIFFLFLEAALLLSGLHGCHAYWELLWILSILRKEALINGFLCCKFGHSVTALCNFCLLAMMEPIINQIVACICGVCGLITLDLNPTSLVIGLLQVHQNLLSGIVCVSLKGWGGGSWVVENSGNSTRSLRSMSFGWCSVHKYNSSLFVIELILVYALCDVT